MNGDSWIFRYRMEIVLFGILLLSAFLNIWNIWNLGYSNSYYAAAVKSMLANPGVLFYNSFDAGGFVTVDKPPVGLWVQAASAILFGFSGWALILPQALAGIGSVALIYCIVARPFGKPAGLVAAFAHSITPVFVAVSRNETMDGILIFILLCAIWAALKAARENSLPYLILAVTFVGIGFNTKMIQAFIVVPAVLAVYFLGAGNVPVRHRFLHLALAVAILMIISLSWAVVIDSIPADQRPYIGGSGDNSVLGLIINYNGLHRLENDGAMGPGSGGPQENSLSPDAGRPPSGSGTIPPSVRFERNTTSGERSGGMIPGESEGAPVYGMAYPPGMGGSMPDGSGKAAGTPPGQSGAPGGGMGGGMDNTGSPGLFRLFGSGLAGQLSWLLPFALIGLLAWIRKPATGNIESIADAGYFAERGLVLLAMCLWLIPGLVYFSFTTGFWHTYYLATIAPPLAALTGIVAWEMYTKFRDGGTAAWLLAVVVFVTGCIQVLILMSSMLAGKDLLVLILSNAAIICSLLLAVLILTRRTSGDTIPKVIGVLAIGILFIAPGIWSFATLESGGGALPVGGPAAGPGSGMGRPGSGPGGNTIPGISGSDTGLADYLLSHHNGERWIVGVASSHEAAGLILSTEKPVMAMGGFTGSDQILTTDSVAGLIKDGKIRYFYLSQRTDSRGGSGDSDVTAWIGSRCTAVDASEYGGISAGNASSVTGTQGAGLQGGSTLYDCHTAAV